MNPRAEPVSESPMMTIDELYEEFEFLGDWDDQCDFLIDLGFELPTLPDEAKKEENRVHGCQSNVWLTYSTHTNGETTIDIQAESDALIVNGLIAVLLAMFSGKTPEGILSTNVTKIFERIGLNRFLSPARRNGLFGMVNRIQDIAKQAE